MTTTTPASRTVSTADTKLLWGMAAARCAFPQCRRVCSAPSTTLDPAVVLGEMAHIVAHSDLGPRGDPEYPAERRATYENMILLCSPHHTTVDRQPNSYTMSDLRTWKTDHESWVRVRLAQEMPNVGFAELEVVTRAILALPEQPNTSYAVTPPAEKMAKNGLSSRVRLTLQMGLAGGPEVEKFVDYVGVRDSEFPERLRSGFLLKYEQLRAEGLRGDAVFHSLVEFASGPSSDILRIAAGLAVVGYLFMTCEVFEK